jgi:glycosyltransferase involved in cell wall biosynthesis
MPQRNPATPPRISVCLVVRNAASTLEKTLLSVRARAPDAEIVIVDTLSDDAGIDIRVSKDEFLASLSPGEKADPHSAVEARLKVLGFTPLFVRLLREEWAFDEEGVVPVPCVWARVKGTEHEGRDLHNAAAVLGGKTVWHVSKGETTQEISKRFADVWAEYAGPDGSWTKDLAWITDMASARNVSFGLATAPWVGWIDADDVWPDPAEVERLLKLNGRWRPPPPMGGGTLGKGPDEKDPHALASLEDMLTFAGKVYPNLTMIKAPYLYERDPESDGRAVVWQERERFVRRAPEGSNAKVDAVTKLPFRWVSEAHEFLVPVDIAAWPPHTVFTSLLYLHEKEFTLQDKLFATTRHWNVLLSIYEKTPDKRNTRDCLYLANYSLFLDPKREDEFLAEADRLATGAVDVLRSLVAQGDRLSRGGSYFDAKLKYAAAMAAVPHLPDPYVSLGEAALKVGDFGTAAEAFARASEMPAGHIESSVAPAVQVLKCRLQRAKALVELARGAVKRFDFPRATALYTEAVACCAAAKDSPLGAEDAQELHSIHTVVLNEAKGHEHALALAAAFDFLRLNDETLKASHLLACVPHNVEDHPAITALEPAAFKVERHLSDPAAYVAFYNSPVCTDVVASEEFLANALILDRTAALINRLLKMDKPTIIEFGTYDGVSVLPILKNVPGVRVVAVDAQRKALDRMKEKIKDQVPAALEENRVVFVESGFGLPGEGQAEETRVAVGDALLAAGWIDGRRTLTFDAAILFEVIEHVPDPIYAVEQLFFYAPQIFVSTPWGAYDKGAPWDAATREVRGHVRAMTAWDMRVCVRMAGGRIERLTNHAGQFEIGNTMYVEAKALDVEEETL